MKTSFARGLRNVASYGVAFLIAATFATVAMAGEISMDSIWSGLDEVKTGMVVLVAIIVTVALCYALWHAFNYSIAAGFASLIFVVLAAGLIYEAIA